MSLQTRNEVLGLLEPIRLWLQRRRENKSSQFFFYVHFLYPSSCIFPSSVTVALMLTDKSPSANAQTHVLLKSLKRGQNSTEGRPHFNSEHIRILSYEWSWKDSKGLRVQLYKKVHQKARDKVKALKAGLTQRSEDQDSNKKKKTEMHVKDTP